MKCSCDDARSRRALLRHLVAKAAADVSDVVGTVVMDALRSWTCYFGKQQPHPPRVNRCTAATCLRSTGPGPTAAVPSPTASAPRPGHSQRR